MYATVDSQSKEAQDVTAELHVSSSSVVTTAAGEEPLQDCTEEPTPDCNSAADGNEVLQNARARNSSPPTAIQRGLLSQTQLWVRGSTYSRFSA